MCDRAEELFEKRWIYRSRLGYTVVPKELKCGDVSLNAMWARRHGTKFNGAPYIQQRAGEAVYSEPEKHS